jgi:hypothetical protein
MEGRICLASHTQYCQCSILLLSKATEPSGLPNLRCITSATSATPIFTYANIPASTSLDRSIKSRLEVPFTGRNMNDRRTRRLPPFLFSLSPIHFCLLLQMRLLEILSRFTSINIRHRISSRTSGAIFPSATTCVNARDGLGRVGEITARIGA